MVADGAPGQAGVFVQVPFGHRDAGPAGAGDAVQDDVAHEQERRSLPAWQGPGEVAEADAGRLAAAQREPGDAHLHQQRIATERRGGDELDRLARHDAPLPQALEETGDDLLRQVAGETAGG